MGDAVNHPDHYTGDPSGVEAIELLEHMTSFCIASAMKYVWRAGKKGDAVEDLKKAEWYLTRELERAHKNVIPLRLFSDPIPVSDVVARLWNNSTGAGLLDRVIWCLLQYDRVRTVHAADVALRPLRMATELIVAERRRLETASR